MTHDSTAAIPRWNPQRPSPMPHHRYLPAHDRVHVALSQSERSWPSHRITTPPLWVPVDLRDGNQALPEPMDSTRKLRMFNMLTSIGYKEIEVAYPSSSQTDFDFVRYLASSDDVPEDVTVSVFTPARTNLIDRTIDSARGLKNVLIHMYAATAPTWRDIVLNRSTTELHRMIIESASHLARAADKDLTGTNVRFEFSPEVFNLTEPDFVLQLCNDVTKLWDASPDRPVVINLPATIEIGTPNIYADQIEYMHRNLDRRQGVILSVHPHNDRGTGVACAELALLAGAQRVEGCMFGNGERTGNVDLVTLALNLYTQGINPMIDLSEIDAVRAIVEDSIQIPTHIRHPYAGDLVHTAFSGTHQDAIAKGLAHHLKEAERAGSSPEQAPWNVPYLPIDPADIGRTYEEVIRINSQSGKGGIAHLLETSHGLDLPKSLRPDFYTHVQSVTDGTGQEQSNDDLWKLFESTYLSPAFDGPVQLSNVEHNRTDATHSLSATLSDGGLQQILRGTGTGPIDALLSSLNTAGIAVSVDEYSEHATDTGSDAKAVAYMSCTINGIQAWGAGADRSILTAATNAVISAINRSRR